MPRWGSNEDCKSFQRRKYYNFSGKTGDLDSFPSSPCPKMISSVFRKGHSRAKAVAGTPESKTPKHELCVRHVKSQPKDAKLCSLLMPAQEWKDSTTGMDVRKAPEGRADRRGIQFIKISLKKKIHLSTFEDLINFIKWFIKQAAFHLAIEGTSEMLYKVEGFIGRRVGQESH